MIRRVWGWNTTARLLTPLIASVTASIRPSMEISPDSLTGR
jgi:hypothetical protein